MQRKDQNKGRAAERITAENYFFVVVKAGSELPPVVVVVGVMPIGLDSTRVQQGLQQRGPLLSPDYHCKQAPHPVILTIILH